MHASIKVRLGHQVPSVVCVETTFVFYPAQLVSRYFSFVSFASRPSRTVVCRGTRQHFRHNTITNRIPIFRVRRSPMKIVFPMPVKLAPAHCRTRARAVIAFCRSIRYTIFRIRYCTVFDAIQKPNRQCCFDAAPAWRLRARRDHEGLLPSIRIILPRCFRSFPPGYPGEPGSGEF